MIYKMTIADSSDSMTFDLLETPIVDKDIEGAVDNVTLDGNQYTDYLWLKKQYMQKWAILCDTEYTQLRGFYTRQFENATIPTYRLYYGTNSFLDKTVSGEYITTTVSGIEEAPLSTISLLGNTTQDGTPTPDSPVSISTVTGANTVKITGKNLANPDTTDKINAYINGSGVITSNAQNQLVYYQVQPNTTYTISITRVPLSGQESVQDDIRVGVTSTEPASSVQLYDVQYANLSDSTLSASFTVSTGSYTWLVIKYANTTKTDADATLATLQIELGSTATDYEAYQGQSYEINLGGTNLCGFGEIVVQGYCSASLSDDLKLIVTPTGLGNPQIRFTLLDNLPAGTYTFNSQTSLSSSTQLRTSDNTSIANFGSNKTGTFTTTAVASKIEFNFANPNNTTPFTVDLSTFQIEKGSQATPYVPYVSYQYELAKIGDYQDYIFKNTSDSAYYDDTLTEDAWYIHKEVGKVVFDGTEAWAVSNTGTTSFYYVVSGVATDAMATLGTTCRKLMSNYGSGDVAVGNANTDEGIMITTSDGGVRVRYGTEMSVADWQTKLGTTNMTLYYPLATATDTEITDEALLEDLEALEDIKLFLGVNNITTETENEQPTLNIKYTEIYSRETDVVSTTAVRLTLTDDGVINNCGCRQNVQLTMRETVS